MKVQKNKKSSFFSAVKRKYFKVVSALTFAITGVLTSMISILPSFAAASTPAATVAGNGIPAGGGSGAAPKQNVDQTWNDIIKMIFVWAGRAALVMAAWGAFQFFLAFKSDDGEKKQSSLFMLIAGIGAFAVTLSLDLFGIL
jgi:hypothetical protein